MKSLIKLNLVIFFILAVTSFSKVFAFENLKPESSSDFDYNSLDSVFNKYVENGLVNYNGIRNDNALNNYLNTVKTFDPNSITENTARLTFWINAYNAFTIKLITDYYPVKSIMDIKKKAGENPWSIEFIEIGGKFFSLDEIEKDIIIPEFGECRIHYALVCAAMSCPPLRSEAYLPDKLSAQLDDQATIFINDKSNNYLNRKNNTLYLSMIYKWYGSDFRDCSGSVVKQVAEFINEEDREFMRKRKTDDVNYLKYSWKLNEWK